jgi:hypothetical protein
MKPEQPETSQSLGSTSTRISLPSAPTPYNTYATETYGSISIAGRSGVYDEDSIVPVLPQGSIGAVPFSTIPVPAPPVIIRQSDSKTEDPEAFKQAIGPLGIERDAEAPHTGDSWSQEDIDAHRLRQLGYDPVLGRDYTFWSSLAISTCNIGSLQVRKRAG